MKTFEDKAVEWLQENMGDHYTSYHKSSLILLLREQDRDTRHACAQNMLELDKEMHQVPLIADAHGLCLNAKGG